MTKIKIDGRDVDEELLLTYIDFVWGEWMTIQTKGEVLRGDATRNDIHAEIMKSVGLEYPTSTDPTFEKALEVYAETHKPRFD